MIRENFTHPSATYDPVLDAIGRSIFQKKSSFALDREPKDAEEMIVWLRHANGSQETIPASKYVITGQTLTITDYDLVLSFKADDHIIINHQPKTAS